MRSLGIAIDGGRYVRIDSRLGDMPKTVRLRTLAASQKSAKLDFCAFSKHGPVIKDTVRLTGLTPREDERAELRLRADRRSFAVWDISIRGSGVSRDIRVRTGIGLWPLILLLAVVLGLGAWSILKLSSDREWGEVTSNSVSQGSVVQEHTQVVEAPQVSQPSESPSVEGSDDGTSTVGEGASSGSANPAGFSDAEVSKGVDQDAATEPQPIAEPESPGPTPPETTIIYFSPDSAAIGTTAARELDELATSVPPGYTILVEGHCAEYGTERGRRTLSAARAENVANFLSERIGGENGIKSAGFGSDRPATTDPQRQELNRRVEIILTPEDKR